MKNLLIVLALISFGLTHSAMSSVSDPELVLQWVNPFFGKSVTIGDDAKCKLSFVLLAGDGKNVNSYVNWQNAAGGQDQIYAAYTQSKHGCTIIDKSGQSQLECTYRSSSGGSWGGEGTVSHFTATKDGNGNLIGFHYGISGPGSEGISPVDCGV